MSPSTSSSKRHHPRPSRQNSRSDDNSSGNDVKQAPSFTSSNNTSTNTSTDTSNIPKRRRSSRGNSSLSELAKEIAVNRKRVVIITGAGISVASGVRPFRGNSGIWQSVIWTTATRSAFRKNPHAWYNDFWLPFLEMPENPTPNAGHLALAALLSDFSNLNMITQNVDGLHLPSERLIEAHGRLGLYKCMPDEDSDTDSDSDDEDDRPVHLGHRRKRRMCDTTTTTKKCVYQRSQSLAVTQLKPESTRSSLLHNSSNILHPPKCPSCGNSVAPQALLFDEGYHAHDYYQFTTMEEWIAQAQVIVFVGTSFAVRLTEVALEHARDFNLPVYNFNTQDFLQNSLRLNAINVTGACEETLPQLVLACHQLLEETISSSIQASSTPAVVVVKQATTTPAAAARSSRTRTIQVES
jgi:NAD-dependent deacetylase